MLLLNEIASISQLRGAWESIKIKGKNTPGVDNITLVSFTSNLSKNLKEISVKLKEKKYIFDAVLQRSIPKPGKSDNRLIGLYSIKDKVVQKSIQISFERIRRRKVNFFPDIYNNVSIGFISRRKKVNEPLGVRKAIDQIKKNCKNGYSVIVTADIKNFFDIIPKKQLYKNIVKQLPDNSINWLIKQTLDPLVLLQDRFTGSIKPIDATEEGITQGSILAPLYSNIYLSKFDLYLQTSKILALRYADDFAFFAKSESEAKKLFSIISLELNKYKLFFHPSSSPKRPRTYNFLNPIKWVKYLGIEMQYSKKNTNRFWLVKPTDEKVGNLRSYIVKTMQRNDLTLLDRVVLINNHLQSWFSTYSYCGCTKRLLGKIFTSAKAIYEDEVCKLLVLKKITTSRLSKNQLIFLGVSSNRTIRSRVRL